jgi:hypothetical protein
LPLVYLIFRAVRLGKRVAHTEHIKKGEPEHAASPLYRSMSELEETT